MIRPPRLPVCPALCICICLVCGAAPLVPSAVTHAAESVSARDLRRFRQELAQLLRKPDPMALSGFVEEMGELDDPRTVVLMPPAAAAMRAKTLHATTVAAVKDLENPESVLALAQLVGNRRTPPREKAAVLHGFALRKDRETLDAIVEALSDRDTRARIAAVRAASLRRRKETIPPLIDILEERDAHKDRLWLEARVALGEITSQSFTAVEDWRKFWAAAGPTFDPAAGSTRRDDGRTVVVSKGATEFFGAEICSHRLVFVVDVSGSMLMYDESEEYRGRSIEKDRQRLRRAQLQLARALKRLPPRAAFNVIAYSDKVRSWKPALQRATSSNVKRALRFVLAFEAKGPTHTDEALETAMGDPDVDTIVLLSDGAPEKRGSNSPFLIQKIRERLADLNADQRVRIHTFGFRGVGQWPENVPWSRGGPLPRKTPEQVREFTEFLKQIASEHGGEFRPID